jgi:predicted Zn-dependent protease
MSARRADLGLALATLLAAACGTVTIPDRPDPYDFEEQQTGVVFRWPAERLPVRYWVDPEAGVVAEYVARGLEAWQEQFLYGEFRAVTVADSSRADVVVRVLGNPPPDVPLTDDPPVFACGGVTRYEAPDAANRFPAPPVVELTWDAGYGDADVANCLFRVAVHEVGHTLGILAHSPDEFDLMNANPRVAAPSVRDRATVQTLYHTAPTALPPERPR